MGLYNMNKTLLLATAVTAAVFVAHGAAAAVTGNSQTYSTLVTILGRTDGCGDGTGSNELDGRGGTEEKAAVKPLAETGRTRAELVAGTKAS